MHVVPDVIGSFHPSLDLRVVTPGNCGTSEKYRSDKPLPVEPGVYLLPQQVSKLLPLANIVNVIDFIIVDSGTTSTVSRCLPF